MIRILAHVSEIDECSSNPCSDGLICVDGVDEYTCHCVVDGTTDPCCIIGVSGYSCVCIGPSKNSTHCVEPGDYNFKPITPVNTPVSPNFM